MTTLLSGAAEGADSLFSYLALSLGWAQENFSFSGHKAAHSIGIVQLTEKQLEEADPHVAAAAEALGKNFPTNRYTKNLLRRNYFQVRDTKLVIAVAESLTTDGKHVEGGTGWAVEMAKKIPAVGIYVFCQQDNVWYSYSRENEIFQQFPTRPKFFYFPDRPKFFYFPDRVTGIGTRNLSQRGAQEIVKMMLEVVLKDSIGHAY